VIIVSYSNWGSHEWEFADSMDYIDENDGETIEYNRYYRCNNCGMRGRFGLSSSFVESYEMDLDLSCGENIIREIIE